MTTDQLERLIHTKADKNAAGFICDMMVMACVAYLVLGLIGPQFRKDGGRISILEARASVEDIVTQPASRWFTVPARAEGRGAGVGDETAVFKTSQPQTCQMVAGEDHE